MTHETWVVASPYTLGSEAVEFCFWTSGLFPPSCSHPLDLFPSLGFLDFFAPSDC